MKRPGPTIPRSVVAGLILAIALDTVVQIAWKRAVSGVPAGAPAGTTARAVLSSRFFYAAMLALCAQFANWMRVLKRADLSFAQPFTALGYVSVLTVSSRLLHESLTWPRIVGVGFIFLGVFFISRTPSVTTAEASLS